MNQNMSTTKKDISCKIKCIVEQISQVTIDNQAASLFGAYYGLTAELFVYILLEVTKEFNFTVNDEFVIDLKDYSFNHLVEATIMQVGELT